MSEGEEGRLGLYNMKPKWKVPWEREVDLKVLRRDNEEGSSGQRRMRARGRETRNRRREILG